MNLDDIEYWKFDGEEAKSYDGGHFTLGEIYWVIKIKNIIHFSVTWGEYAIRDNYKKKEHLQNINYPLDTIFYSQYSRKTMNEYFTRIL